jgi:hypothetical protein
VILPPAGSGIASKTTAGILESESEAGKITHRWYIVFAAADLADVGLLLSRPFRRPRRSGRIADLWIN